MNIINLHNECEASGTRERETTCHLAVSRPRNLAVSRPRNLVISNPRNLMSNFIFKQFL